MKLLLIVRPPRRWVLTAALLAARLTTLDSPRPALALVPNLAATVERLEDLQEAARDSAAAVALRGLIPSMEFGAPATNATLPAAVAANIEERAADLERAFDGRNLVRDANLNGSWRLLYSNSKEILNLAAGFPGGFTLGPTYQPIDVALGFFENHGSVINRYGLARLSTCVVGDVSPALAGSLNAVGVANDRGNRIDVNFRRITFQLDELFGRPASLRKVLVPTQQADAAQPANDITYLDGGTRIVRGGDGALFIFAREESPRPLLSAQQREALYADARAVGVTTGTGMAEDSAPPELKRLLRDR